MGSKSRDKGQRGERELFDALSDLLGFSVRRNAATRAGGGDPDSFSLPGWAPEVKRAEKFLSSYWQQANEQALKIGAEPVLFYRANRQPWTVFVRAELLTNLFDGVVRISLEQYAQLYRAALVYIPQAGR